MLADGSRRLLLSSNGAHPINDVDRLREALDAMFDERVSRQLEVVVLPGIFFPDTSTCSTETQMAN